jgi:hypothetical protein
MSTEVLATVGRCIYCGATDQPLRNEHVVPFALDGKWILRAASCADCALRTSRVEREVLRRGAGALRAAIGLRTRRSNARPRSYSYRILLDGVESAVDIPISDYAPLFWFPMLRPPGALSGEQRDVTIYAVRSIQVWNNAARYRTLEELARALGVQQVSQELTYKPIAMGQLLAKVAYGMSVAHLGVDTFESVHVLPAILTGENIGTWVGGASAPKWADVEPEHLHLVQLDQRGQEVVAHVKLLARYGGPEYEVLVGRRHPPTTAR